MIASGSDDKTARLWDAATGDCIATFQGHNDGVKGVAFSPDSSILVTACASGDKSLRLWDTKALKLVCALASQSFISDISFSPDGVFIACAEGASVALWSASERRLVKTMVGPSDVGAIRSVDFSPDGAYVVSSGDDGVVRVWEVSSGKCVTSSDEGHWEGVPAIAFTADNKTMLSLGCGTRVATAPQVCCVATPAE